MICVHKNLAWNRIVIKSADELVTFDLRTLAWSRLTEASLMPEKTSEVTCPRPIGGGPLATHTYDGLVYHAERKTIFRFLGAPYCWAGTTYDRKAWEFDPANRKWTEIDAPLARNKGPVGKTLYDPVSKRIIMVDQDQGYAYDPATGQIVMGEWGNSGWGGHMDLDPVRRRGVIINKSGISSIDISGAVPGRPLKVTLTGDVLNLAEFHEGGISYDRAGDRFILWAGGREIYALNAETWEVTLYSNPVGPAPVGTRLVYSKWQCLAEIDACVGYNDFESGVWIYRLTTTQQSGGATIPGLIRVCPPENFTTDCDVQSIQAAGLQAKDGDTITVRAGVYEQAAILRAHNLTIQAEAGAHLRNGVAENKAALVIKGNDMVIVGLECSGISISAGNGACIRLEGVNLTLRNVNFHDSQEGILAGGAIGDVLIEGSLFERLGGAENIQLGRAHAIYISGGNSLTVRNTRVLSSKEEGHEVKSRAARTVIENSVIASLDGVDSRLIDVPNGGELVIRDSVLEIGPNSSNSNLIGHGLEGITHAMNTILIEGNIIITDRSQSVLYRGSIIPTIEGNTLVGGKKVPGNTWFADRVAAGLGAYPALP